MAIVHLSIDYSTKGHDITKLQLYRYNKQRSGFTLIELVIVIVIIGVLSGIIITVFIGFINGTKDRTDANNAAQLVKIAEKVNANEGTYPSGTTASFNSDAVGGMQIPTGESIINTSSAPAYSTVLAQATSGPSYYVQTCTGGVNVYYPIRTRGVLGTLKAGAGC